MNGVEELKSLHEAGFSDEEKNTWAMGRRKELSDAGFGQGEIDTYFGQPPFDPAPVKAYVNATLKQATQSSTEGGNSKASQLADLVGKYIDEPRGTAPGLGNPTHPDDPRYKEFAAQMSKIIGTPFYKGSKHDVRQFGETYNPEEYRGIRFLLPDSHGKPVKDVFGDTVPGHEALLKDFKDEMIKRGYPLLGGVGQLQGFKEGFNPVGFGQRDSVTVSATEAGQPKPVTDFTDALKAGFGESVTGLLMGKPTATVAPDAPRMSRIAGQVGSLAGDVPAMMGGFLAGGGPASPVTGMAGAFALPAGIRKILMDKYDKGEAQSFGDFWDRFSGAFIDTAKGWITGAATGAVGKAIGLAPIVSPTAKAAATMTGEVATMVTVGKALEGQIPEPNDFIDTALTLGFVKGSMKMASKLRNIYAETGVKPDQVAADIQQDPTILHDLASDNVAIPKTYQQPTSPPSVSDLHAKAEKAGMAWDNSPAFMDLTESLTGKRHLDALTPAERAQMGTMLDEWNPDIAMGGGAPGRAAKPTNIPIGTAQKAVLDRIVQKEPETERMTLSDLYTSVVDNLNPIKQALKAGGKADLPTAENPYSLERLTRGTMGKATEFLKHGAFDFSTYKTVTKGYEQILEPVKKDLDGFRAYMVSKRAIEKAGQGIETGVPIEEAKTVVREGKAKYEQIHQERLAYREALLNYLHKSGIVNVEQVSAMREANKDYVPFYRFFEESEKQRHAGAGGTRNPIKQMTGSERQIIDPIVSDIKDTFLFVGLAEKNAARQAFTTLGPDFAEKQKQPLHATKLTESEMARLSGESATGKDVATIFRSLQKPLAKDEIAVFTDGHRDVYKVDPKVAEAFNGLDAVSTGLVARMLYAPASLLRAGVVITPDFIARNIMRDAVSAFIYAGSNPIKTALGLKSIATKDTAFHSWMKGGGANATMVAIDRDYIQSNLVDLNDKTGIMRRAWNVATTPLDVLRAASELVENSTRLGAVRSDLLKSQDKARIQALSLIAREATVDFARHGKDTQAFARSTAFFNPAIQGIDRFAREMKNNPVATTAKAFAAVTLPSMLLWWVNKDDEEIQNLPRWQKDLFWVTRAALPGGGSFILRIPKPQEFGIVFGTVPERLLDAFVKDNPTAMRDLENSLLNAFLPSMIPTAAIPIISQFANRDTFQGHPLIPAGQEGLLPEYQYTEYTTETAKAMGQIIGAFPGMEKAAVSSNEPFIGGTARALTTPILLENYLRSWTGGMGYYLLQLADKGLREAGVVPDPVKPAWTLSDVPFVKAFTVRYPSASAQSIQDFFNDSTVSQKYFDTIMSLAKQGDQRAVTLMEAHQSDMAQLTDIRGAITEQSQIIRMIYKNPDITSDEKRQLIDTLYYRMIELSRAGNEGLRQLKETVK